MLSKESPGRANLSYYYRNGKLFGTHYEGFASREDELLELMKAEEQFLIEQNHPLPFWVNFYGTQLTDRVLSEFVQSMNRLRRYIPKLAIVGCSLLDRWRLRRVEKRLNMKLPAPVRYFSDPEAAKTWLVSEPD